MEQNPQPNLPAQSEWKQSPDNQMVKITCPGNGAFTRVMLGDTDVTSYVSDIDLHIDCQGVPLVVLTVPASRGLEFEGELDVLIERLKFTDLGQSEGEADDSPSQS